MAGDEAMAVNDLGAREKATKAWVGIIIMMRWYWSTHKVNKVSRVVRSCVHFGSLVVGFRWTAEMNT